MNWTSIIIALLAGGTLTTIVTLWDKNGDYKTKYILARYIMN